MTASKPPEYDALAPTGDELASEPDAEYPHSGIAPSRLGDGMTVSLRGPGAAVKARDGARGAPDAFSEREERPWLTDLGVFAAGGMGRIHTVHDRRLRRKVAMKAMNDARGGPDDRVRFIEEAQISGQLDHPNIPPVHDLWLDQAGELCFTMKLVHGETLSKLLSNRPLAERTDAELERLLQIFLKVCDAISFAHARGVIHRDLKPDNVMVGTHGQVYVMDWGCALILDGGTVSIARDPKVDPIEQPGILMGTAAYMAPEQARGGAVDERTDVYLLGAMLYQILTGRAPHSARNFIVSLLSAQKGEVPDPQTVAGDVALPVQLCDIALRALAPDPADRQPSVAALKDEVESSLREGWWFATRTFAAGALVVEEGEPADAAYIITDGWCEVFRVVDGKRVVLRRMGPGDVFGETAIFTDQPRTASVQALEALTTRVVLREALDRAFGGAGGGWLRALVRALADRFRELDAQRTR